MRYQEFNLLEFKSRCLNCGLLPVGWKFSHGLNNECITLGKNRRNRCYWPSDNLEYLEWKYGQHNKTI